jgi:hypothetical protein
MDRLKTRINFQVISTPLLLLGVSIACYGLLIPWLGFYWDDWPAIWFYHLFGSSGFSDVFAIDRPLLGWLFTLTTPINGESALRWQVFALLARWLCSLSVWWLLRAIWPERRLEAVLVALLFLVYPGFTQQHIAVTYSHAWLIMAGFFASLALMIEANRRLRWFWPLLGLSLGLSFFTLFTVEYFVGLELLRPVLLWLVISETVSARRQKLKCVLLQWLPYLAALLAFFVWRVILSSTPRGEVTLLDALSRSPASALFDLARTILEDFIKVTLNAWGAITQISGWVVGPNLASAGLFLLVTLTAAGVGLLLWFTWRGQTGTSEAPVLSNTRWGWGVLMLGIYAILISGWPFWATNLPIRLVFPFDRFTLAFMFGAALVLMGLLSLLVARRANLIVAVSLLVGLAAGFHFQNAVTYRNQWEGQKSYFWQLTWRAPMIEPGTTLMFVGSPFIYFTDNSLVAPLNWTFAPENMTRAMDYLIVDVPVRLGLSLEGLQKDMPIYESYRATEFHGSTSRSLALHLGTNACLRVLDPALDSQIYIYPSLLYKVIRHSDLSLIDATIQTPARPPAHIFGSEPKASWCYYYQKADLARQQGDWETVMLLGDGAFEQQLFPNNAYEFLPLIAGNAHMARWNKAVNMTRNSLEADYKAMPALCTLWSTLDQQILPSDEKAAAIAELDAMLECFRP